MRAVTGRIRSSKALSLSHTARFLRQFAASETSAPPETAVFVRRTSAAFDELLGFRYELNNPHQNEEEKEDGGHGDLERVTGDKKEKKKKRKRENAEEKPEHDVNTEKNMGLDEKNDDEELGSDKMTKKKKRKKEKKEQHRNGLKEEKLHENQ